MIRTMSESEDVARMDATRPGPTDIYYRASPFECVTTHESGQMTLRLGTNRTISTTQVVQTAVVIPASKIPPA